LISPLMLLSAYWQEEKVVVEISGASEVSGV
jgi:hypothetical protein